jgi:hypothetical protein
MWGWKCRRQDWEGHLGCHITLAPGLHLSSETPATPSLSPNIGLPWKPSLKMWVSYARTLRIHPPTHNTHTVHSEAHTTCNHIPSTPPWSHPPSHSWSHSHQHTCNTHTRDTEWHMLRLLMQGFCACSNLPWRIGTKEKVYFSDSQKMKNWHLTSLTFWKSSTPFLQVLLLADS